MNANKKISSSILIATVIILSIYLFQQDEKTSTTLSKTQNKIEIPKKIENTSVTYIQPQTSPGPAIENDPPIVPQNRHWKKKVEKDLLAFMPEQTTVKIEVLKVLDEIPKQDVVKITYRKKDGATSTFKALIESSSGKILRTWDQAIFEPHAHKKVSIAISGAL